VERSGKVIGTDRIGRERKGHRMGRERPEDGTGRERRGLDGIGKGATAQKERMI
jgi:hypothetical protein